MTAASNSEARKRLADPTPHADPTAAAVRAAQAEALREAADALLLAAPEWSLEVRPKMLARHKWAGWLRDRADRLATDTAAPEGATCWRSECRSGCYYPRVCSETTHAAPVAVEGVETVETLAEVRERRPHILSDVLDDHRATFSKNGDEATCRCNGLTYETPDWRLHVGREQVTALDEDAAHHLSPSEPEGGESRV